eukprot:364337-Chlamydomonas_euryale.AAC.10
MKHAPQDRKDVHTSLAVASSRLAAWPCLHCLQVERRLVERMEDKKCGAAIAADVEAWRQGELQHARAAADSRAAFRNHIDEQLKDKAHQRRCAPMTDVELRINREKMEMVKAFHQTGKLVLPGLL